MGHFFDLHRHDEMSFFDGFGKPSELARIAKELGYPALGTSNHGNISSLVRHWRACLDEGIKPVLGCEVYFQPKFNKELPRRESYHLCLFVKNYEGYRNLCRLMSESAMEQFYYKPIVDFGLLKKYSDGLICTTACVQGAMSQAVLNGNKDTAERLLLKYKEIFGKDLYVEIQPYKIDNKGTQETANYELMKIARKHKVNCILTSDSHYGRREDFDTYLKLHDIAKHDLEWVRNTYSERYMPSEADITERFAVMYKDKIKRSMDVAERFADNMEQLYDSIEMDILSHCEAVFPELEDCEDSEKMLRKLTIQGLKRRGKYKKEYIERCKKELEVINYHGFNDYFIMVQDYVNWAKKKGIEVGPGRGSACNCLVSYAIGITDVDSIKYKLDFSRFMRKEKKAMPKLWATLVNVA